MSPFSRWSSVCLTVVLKYSVKLHPTVLCATQAEQHTRGVSLPVTREHRSHTISSTIFHRVQSQLSLWARNIQQIKRHFISTISRNDLLVRTRGRREEECSFFPNRAIATRGRNERTPETLRSSNQNRKYIRCARPRIEKSRFIWLLYRP